MNSGLSHKAVTADFAAADDVLAAAEMGALAELGSLRLTPSGRIGPIVEILMAKRDWASAMTNVQIAIPFADPLDRAMNQQQISGTGYRSRSGAFPLARLCEDGQDTTEWELWCSRAEQAAVASSFPKPLASAIIGAMIEFQDNVHLHSGRPGTGVVAYGSSRTHFEIVVADAGIGVLASLRQNHEHAGLTNAGSALKVAIRDGASRLGSSGGYGFGMGQMFRALANHDGELRFRSDDYALIVRGHSPSLSGSIELRHKAGLRGLIVSVRCPAPHESLADL